MDGNTIYAILVRQARGHLSGNPTTEEWKMLQSEAEVEAWSIKIREEDKEHNLSSTNLGLFKSYHITTYSIEELSKQNMGFFKSMPVLMFTALQEKMQEII